MDTTPEQQTTDQKVDFIRLYSATALECLKCDNWEEGNATWSCFEHIENDGTDEGDHYKCSECGSCCVKESEIREWRDYE